MTLFDELKNRLGENIEKLAEISDSTSKLAEGSLRTLRLGRQAAQRSASHWDDFQGFIDEDRTTLEKHLMALKQVEESKDFNDQSALIRTLSTDKKSASQLSDVVNTRIRKITAANNHAYNAVHTSLGFFNDSIQAAFLYLAKKSSKSQDGDKHALRLDFLTAQANLVPGFIEQALTLKNNNLEKIQQVWGKQACKNRTKLLKGGASSKEDAEHTDEKTSLLGKFSITNKSSGKKVKPDVITEDFAVEAATSDKKGCCSCLSFRKR